MPYYVFKMTTTEGMDLIKHLELLTEFESFREAKHYAKERRAEQAEGDTAAIKVMFADNRLAAEEQLLAHREKPIVMEHEK